MEKAGLLILSLRQGLCVGRIAMDLESFCLRLLSARIMGMGYHVQLWSLVGPFLPMLAHRFLDTLGISMYSYCLPLRFLTLLVY